MSGLKALLRAPFFLRLHRGLREGSRAPVRTWRCRPTSREDARDPACDAMYLRLFAMCRGSAASAGERGGRGGEVWRSLDAVRLPWMAFMRRSSKVTQWYRKTGAGTCRAEALRLGIQRPRSYGCAQWTPVHASLTAWGNSTRRCSCARVLGDTDAQLVVRGFREPRVPP